MYIHNNLIARFKDNIVLFNLNFLQLHFASYRMRTATHGLAIYIRVSNLKVINKLLQILMARLSIWVCLILVFHLFSSSDPRPLYPCPESRNPNRYGAVLKGAKGTFRINWENKGRNPSHYQSKRVSPGGPDPKHHVQESSEGSSSCGASWHSPRIAL